MTISLAPAIMFDYNGTRNMNHEDRVDLMVEAIEESKAAIPMANRMACIRDDSPLFQDAEFTLIMDYDYEPLTGPIPEPGSTSREFAEWLIAEANEVDRLNNEQE